MVGSEKRSSGFIQYIVAPRLIWCVVSNAHLSASQRKPFYLIADWPANPALFKFFQRDDSGMRDLTSAISSFAARLIWSCKWLNPLWKGLKGSHEKHPYFLTAEFMPLFEPVKSGNGVIDQRGYILALLNCRGPFEVNKAPLFCMDTPVKKASLMKWDNPRRERGEKRTYVDFLSLFRLASFHA